MFRAALIGAVLPLLGCLVFAFAYGAFFGAREPWGDIAHGWQGGVNGVKGLFFLAALSAPVVVAFAAVGAVSGVIVWKVTRRGR
jgi:hypothetical protein